MLRVCVVCLAAVGMATAALGEVNTYPPIGYDQLCSKNKPDLRECDADRAIIHALPPYPLTEAVMEKIVEINLGWNRRIRSITDKDKYGVSELWNADTDEGDCEEYVLAKRESMLDLGFSASQLLLTIVLKGDEGHLVLMVRTDSGDLILDNLTPLVKQRDDMSYRLLKHQDPNDPDGQWIAYN